MASALSADDRGAVRAAAREITATKRSLRGRWTRRLRAAGTIAPPAGGLPESLFLAPGGGYRILPGQLEQLGAAARAFAEAKTARDGWVYLRDYGYYAADAAMYLPGKVPPAWRRWELVAARWPRYREFAEPAAALAGEPPVPWCQWLAWLAFLEAVLNDLCAASWCASCLGDQAGVALADTGIARIAGLLAEAGWHWWIEPGRAVAATWPGRLLAVAADPALDALIASFGDRLRSAAAPPWSVRAIREGDVCWQVAAAYEAWWRPLREAHPGRRFLLVSEAFGAIAAGPLWAAMMPLADRTAIELAVSRRSVHEQEMGRVPVSAWRTRNIPADGLVVVHLDDSVFTGRTHTELRETLTGAPEAVYLAALTLDVGTPLNHPAELTVLGRTVAAHMTELTALARSPSGLLPAAASMWTRRKRPARDPVGRVLGGSDRLLATLWYRYAAEVGRA